jgi:hypothetical protein
MTPNAVGEIVDSPLLHADWHTRLTDVQLNAYVRYQFIWLKDNAVDWDAPAHARRRPAWDGGVDNYGVRRTSTWGEISKRVREHNADPGMWVHAHFSPSAELKINPVTSSLPEIRPTMLHSKLSPQIYGRYAQSITDVLWHRFEMAGKTIHDRFLTSAPFNLSEEEQRVYVLCDESYVTAPPFFRYAFASIDNCVPVIEEYLWLAALDYEVHQRAYDRLVQIHNETWWITDELKTAVIAIRQHWENYNG